MKQLKKYFRMINPFNNMEEMPTPFYVAKKILAFLLLYFVVGSIAGEGVIIGGLSFMGYDPLHGVMPSGEILMLIQYYGFAFFALAAILYCRFVEKRSIKSMGFQKSIVDYLIGGMLAGILIALIVLLCCIAGGMSYIGIGKDINFGFKFLVLGGFLIQGAAEEILCRGFLMSSLLKKVSAPWAIFISSTMFMLPHLASMEAEPVFKILGIVNLYLVSILFSLLILCRSNIWISCGLHSVWNFILYGVLGLTLSGGEANTTGFLCFEVNGSNLINGGIYGVEASIITTAIIGITVVVCYGGWKKKYDSTCDSYTIQA